MTKVNCLKRISVILSMCSAMISTPVIRAASILHFDDFTGGGNQVGQALASLGQSATVTGHASFAADLSSQPWDLVIVDISQFGISDPNQTALINYISGGGRALMSYYDLDTAPSLANAFEASVALSYDNLPTLYAWDYSHAIFNGVSSPVTFGPEYLVDNGDELNTLGGGVAIAGFSAASVYGRAGIILGNQGRTIVNGWSFDELSGQNGINLVANEIIFLVPEPSTVLLGFAAGLSLWFWRVRYQGR